MRYGEQIGLKFERDGSARRYPGNTVISDVTEGNPAYRVMLGLRERLLSSGLAPLFILLPQDSYHMTVIRGVNDLVRVPEYWPAALSPDAPMADVDGYVARAVGSVANPGRIGMVFDSVRADGADVRVRLLPRDETQRLILTEYRDRVADALGLRLPGHDAYTYHLTLAYTLCLPDAEQAGQLAALIAEMNEHLRVQPPFFVDAPYMAYYEDMLYFSRTPLSRAR